MARAPFQCLILPYIIEDEVIKYGVFKRSDHGFWQFISGGGEDNETPLEAAHRECYEEAEIPMDTPIYPMDSNCSIPAEIFCDEYIFKKHLISEDSLIFLSASAICDRTLHRL